jgi:hypothetical protein
VRRHAPSGRALEGETDSGKGWPGGLLGSGCELSDHPVHQGAPVLL